MLVTEIIVITRYLRNIWGPMIAALIAAVGLVSCANNSAWLNSDRIERTFGSYGVDILHTSPMKRISSLHSIELGVKTTRTYAVVTYADEPHPSLLEVHQRIVAGGSIGATFRSAGWTINKQAIFIGEFEVPETYLEIGELMRVELPARFAAHVYLFNVEKDGRTQQYASIAEIHHPDYLTLDRLHAIYGEIIYDDSARVGIEDYLGPPNALK